MSKNKKKFLKINFLDVKKNKQKTINLKIII